MYIPTISKKASRYEIAADASLSPGERDDLELTEGALGCLFLVLVLVCAPLALFALAAIYEVCKPPLPGSIHTIRGMWLFAMIPGVLASFLLAHWTDLMICRIVMPDRYRRYQAWGRNRHADWTSRNRVTNSLGVLFTVISIIVVFALARTYIALFDDRIEIHKTLAWRVESHSYSDVKNIRIWQSKDKDSEKPRGHFALRFADGTTWGSDKSLCGIGVNDALIFGNFVASKSGVAIDSELAL